jgi:hypothetical protein
MSSKIWILLLTSSLVPALAGCGLPDDGKLCDNGKCDDPPDSEVPDSPCDGIMIDKTGKGFQKVAGRLGDPVANLVFRNGETCPTTFQDIMNKLREFDTEGCDPSNERAGIQTRVISETAQAAGAPTNYRAVTTRRCNSRSTDGVIFSLFGLRAGAANLPAAVEIMAFDETAGVFNYYETDGRELHFFGNSKDMLKGAGANGDRRCAQCHTGGGLIMKELDTPWLHWEGHMDTPGARELVEAHADLGTKATGAEFEGVTKAGNVKWNKTRLAHLTERDDVNVQDILRPLFCDVELNLDNGADFPSPVGGGRGGDELRRIPFDSLLDPQLKGFGSISVEFTDYDELIKANGQRIQGVPGAIDTVFDYTFVERAHADNDFINQLKGAGIIDDDFIKDVLMVDFTRHVFSTDRCGLLTFAPDLGRDELTADNIRDGFIRNLEAETPAPNSPAAVLLAHLQTKDDSAAHIAKVDAFTNACKDLGSRAFLQNALAITSLNRNKAREHHVFEFEATMPIDNLRTDENARLHPQTCQVVNRFVAP